jgi:hypothetical protein
MSRVDHERKIRNCRGRIDIGEYSFVDKTIGLWNRLAVESLRSLPCKPNIYKEGWKSDQYGELKEMEMC